MCWHYATARIDELDPAGVHAEETARYRDLMERVRLAVDRGERFESTAQ
jgi:hypothetical protein